MKKVITWTLYVLALVAIALCFVFPVQAKEVSNNVMNILNTPIAIAGITITLGGLLSFVISKYLVSNTKFGRKELDGVKEEFEELKNTVEENKKSVEDIVASCTNGYFELKSDCENMVSIVFQQFEDLQDKMLKALEAIPNKKVQAIIAEYKVNYESKREEIINKTINTNEYIDSKIAEMKAEFDKLVEKLKHEEENNQTTEE